jgi:hypothetical protein
MCISYDLLVCMFDQIHILFCLWDCILDLQIVNKIQIQIQIQIPLLPFWAFMACSRVKFTFTFNNKNKSRYCCIYMLDRQQQVHTQYLDVLWRGGGRITSLFKLVFHDDLYFVYYNYELVHWVSLASPWKIVNNGYYFAFTLYLIKPINELC